MKKFINSRYAPLSLVLLQIIIVLFLYPQLPDEIPMQFSMSQDVNWTLPKIFGVWAFPACTAVIAFLGISKANKSKASIWLSTFILFIIGIGFLVFIIFLQ